MERFPFYLDNQQRWQKSFRTVLHEEAKKGDWIVQIGKKGKENYYTFAAGFNFAAAFPN